MRVLLRPGETKVLRNGRDPSWSGSSTVNCMCGSCVLIYCGSCWLFFASRMTKVSSTYFSHKQVVWCIAKSLNFKLFNKQVDNKGANKETHGSTMDLFIFLCAFEAELQ